ncbi:HD domain-containing protein [Mitsuokella sp. oral taxon 131]|uniref:HD domain-containing protein n=1 Tax=Mitsuokella sp. oral taxon 131 TaxID=1321780 RepID=UPI0003AE6DA3|nr:HD domain-containing protein [Mitsuokella sp. oral taxon 131]ERL03717.1 putative dGTPase [Mitsuokella sp. oral taxon 131 str. W9106]
MAEKRFKDPVYGYISVDLNFMEIVDTSEFQRLRRIIQTSYSPLYSSAMHNRFVHSLGVFHLGKIASEQLKKENQSKSFVASEEMERNGYLFQLACLLHDVGHAPFSHTGEEFFLGAKGEYEDLHNSVSDLVGDEIFKKDIPTDESDAAAPHELMSAIVALRNFSACFATSEERSFFARCIIGYCYNDDNDIGAQMKNIFINMLNSKIIDVDKLDYLIRDAFVTGFDTIHIDYMRLLSSLTLYREEMTEKICLAYGKSALSVLENVVYAHDAERKWIQSHPVVLYDGYLLHEMIRFLNQKISSNTKKLFSEKTLSAVGEDFGDRGRIRLMSDDDIIYLSKNIYWEELGDLGKEYYARTERKHPAWKSEAEYNALLADAGSERGKTLNSIQTTMEHLMSYTMDAEAFGGSCSINKKVLQRLNEEVDQIEKLKQTESVDDRTYRAQKKSKSAMRKVVEVLANFAEQNRIEFDFVILTSKQFNSGFAKHDFAELRVAFPAKEEPRVFPFKKLEVTLEPTEAGQDRAFYLFYKRGKGGLKDLDTADLIRRLISEFTLYRL